MIRWHAGESRIREALDRAISAHPTIDAFARAGKRSGAVVDTPVGPVFVKRIAARPWTRALLPTGSNRRSRIDPMGWFDSGWRQWRTLVAADAAGIRVPRPLACGTGPDGQRIVAMEFFDAAPLNEHRFQTPRDRGAFLEAFGRLVAQFHEAGFIHRDLHWGNVLVGKDGPVLIDMQAAIRSRSRSRRVRDIGSFDYSLSKSFSIADRVRFRAAALGIMRPFDTEARRALRAAGQASDERGRAHAASRTRRTLRRGRQFESIDWPIGATGRERGFRVRDLDERTVEHVLRDRDTAAARHHESTLKDAARARVSRFVSAGGSWIVKEFRTDGPRRIADVFRGSPAKRAWLGGHGLRARGIGAARPLAFVELRKWGLPWRSAVMLQDLSNLVAADQPPEAGLREKDIARALTRLVIALHRRGGIHGDLKASHVLLDPARPNGPGHLIDLEGVRFRRRLSDRDRIRALAELNASLPNHISDATRLEAFGIYAAAVPFAGDRDDCLRRIVAISLERAHRWKPEWTSG